MGGVCRGGRGPQLGRAGGRRQHADATAPHPATNPPHHRLLPATLCAPQPHPRCAPCNLTSIPAQRPRPPHRPSLLPPCPPLPSPPYRSRRAAVRHRARLHQPQRDCGSVRSGRLQPAGSPGLLLCLHQCKGGRVGGVWGGAGEALCVVAWMGGWGGARRAAEAGGVSGCGGEWGARGCNDEQEEWAGLRRGPLLCRGCCAAACPARACSPPTLLLFTCLQGVSTSQFDVRDVVWREDLGGEQLELGGCCAARAVVWALGWRQTSTSPPPLPPLNPSSPQC